MMIPKEKLQTILAAANNTTGETDTTLTDAVRSLIDGYGGGDLSKIFRLFSSGSVLVPADTQSAVQITHGLGCAPNLIIYMCKNSASPLPKANSTIYARALINDGGDVRVGNGAYTEDGGATIRQESLGPYYFGGIGAEVFEATPAGAAWWFSGGTTIDWFAGVIV